MGDSNFGHVVIVGGGFGGLTAARALKKVPVRVTLVDKENHHLFQPLLYQVATAGLSPGEIAVPIRNVLRKHRDTRVIMGEVVGVDLDARRVELGDGGTLEYDWLVVAAGTQNNYFGHDDWEEHARGLKSIHDALAVRERILMAFEAAEREQDPERRDELLTFVVIGAGPTGVEMAGAISELSRQTLKEDFRVVDPAGIRVVLAEMAPRVLPPFDEKLSASAEKQLEDLQVEVRTGTPVTDVNERGVRIGDDFIPCSTVVWASGVEAVPLAERLGTKLEKGKVAVEPDCSLPGHREVFAIGDIAHLVPEEGDNAGEPLPGLAPVAMQQGRHVVRCIRADVRNAEREPFRYADKGMMATIGRSRAVAQSGKLRLSGLLAWLAWIFVHVWYLIGFRNRLLVMFNWFWSYATFKRGARLIAHAHDPPRHQMAEAHPPADPGSQRPVEDASKGGEVDVAAAEDHAHLPPG